MKPSELKEGQTLILVSVGGTEVVFQRDYSMLEVVIRPPEPKLRELTDDEYFIHEKDLNGKVVTSISPLQRTHEAIWAAHEAMCVYIRFDTNVGGFSNEAVADEMYEHMAKSMSAKA